MVQYLKQAPVYTRDSTAAIAPIAAAVATAEGMEGHALTATMRLERLAARSA